MSVCFIEKYDLYLVDLWWLIDRHVEPVFIDMLSEYDLLEPKIKFQNSDTKKILYHCLIIQLCEFILNKPTNHKVVYCIFKPNRDNLEIADYCTIEDFEYEIKKISKKLNNILPITIFNFPNYPDINTFCNRVLENKGDAIDTIRSVHQFFNKQKRRPFSFEKIKKYTSKYELHFLNNNYFNQLKVKSFLSVG